MKALILANGAFPTKKELLQELKEAQFLAVCDGAIRHLRPLNIEPNVIIGDLDSISLELKNHYKDRLIHIAEQASNDLSKAFYYCLSLGFDEFVILGATGEREDHTLGNISLLCEYVKQCKSIVIKSDFGEFNAYSLPCKIASKRGQQISIFCLNPLVKLTSEGLKYPLKDLSLPLWANGTLNEALGENFILQANQTAQVLIYHQY